MKIHTTKKKLNAKKCFVEFETGSILFLTVLFHMEIIRAAIAMITFFTKTNGGWVVGRWLLCKLLWILIKTLEEVQTSEADFPRTLL